MTEPPRTGPSEGGSPPNPPEHRMWLAELSVRQPVFIAMLVLAVMVVGAIGYTRLGLELFPDISLPIAVVQTSYPGAGPEEVERSVTKPIEDAVASLNGVENVTSTSTDGLSLVIVEFEMSRDSKAAADDVRTRVNVIRNTLPSDVTEPVIQRFDFSSAPALSVAISDSSGKLSPEELRALADNTLKPRLEKVSGVASAEILGGVVRQVQVALDLEQLKAHQIPPQQIIQAIKAENLDVPAGQITDNQRDETLTTSGEAKSLAQLAEIPIVTRPNGPTIRLKNVASISEGTADVQAITRLDGQDSVIANIRKQSRTNTVQVADDAKREIDRLRQDYPDLNFAIAFDQSTYTQESVDDVETSLLLGALLAALVVLVFFRDLRSTIVTVAGLPIILLGTFGAMSVLGMSLNMITLMALSLSVGMLIDDAIVVRENIFRHVERGETPREAAVRGTAEIALAVVAVSSTIVAVFLPIAFTGGIAGEFLRDFGVTVAVAVLISLAESFTLAPMLSAHFFAARPSRRSGGGGPRRGSLWSLFGLVTAVYRAVLGWSLRHRAVVVLLGLAALSSLYLIVPRMTLAFAPNSDRGEFGLGIELDPGARIWDTDRAARAVEKVLSADAEVAHVFTTVGSGSGSDEKATIRVQLRTAGHTEETIARLRPQLEQALDNGKLTVDQQSNSAMTGSDAAIGAVSGRPIQFSVRGDDFALLDQVSADLVARLSEVPGMVDVDRSIKPGKPGRTITVDRTKATDEGVTTAQLGTTVRALVNGERAGVYRNGDQSLDIVARLAPGDRSNLEDILKLPVVTSKGTQVELSKVAQIVSSTGPSEISRANRQRQVVVGGGYLGRSEGAVLADAKAAVAAMELPAGVTVAVSGQAKSQDEMFSSLGIALGLSVLFVYMILASQFGSFIHPFTIMLALPFSAVGALLALYLAGFSFDMLGMIGIILLMGLVAKNSILLVEFVNQLRRRGLGVREAILEAGPTRLRPILMTTIAMIFGMVPVAMGLGAGAELRRPMGVSIIGGLLTSTLLTLIVVPVAYSLVADLIRLFRPERAAGEARPSRGRSGLRWAAGAVVALVVVGVAAIHSPLLQPSVTDGTTSEASPTAGPTAAPLPTSAAAEWVGIEKIAAAPPGPSGQAPPTPTGGSLKVGNTGGIGAYVRKSPGTDAERILAWPDGTPLKALGESADAAGRAWVQVQDPKGNVGWMAKDYLVAARGGP